MIILKKIYFYILIIIFYKIILKLNYKKNNKNIRPFFGFIKNKYGGPSVRTSRMIKMYGNYFFNFNLIYAQSHWSEFELKLLIENKKKIKVPIVFNQNGWFYNGWYKGNAKSRNNLLVDVQKISDFVIFQSKFCLNTGLTFNNFTPKDYSIIHNCIPDFLPKNFKKKNNNKINFLLSGYFFNILTKNINNNDVTHIIFPAIKSFFYILKNIKINKQIKLNIVGIEKNFFKKINNQEIKIMSKELIERKVLSIKNSYNLDEYIDILSYTDVALHLKYKDPCPNSVIERMMAGIPHIYSNSGGTPELVAETGIPINVKETWNDQLSVSSDDLSEKIIQIIKNFKILSKKSILRSKLYNWQNYINKHNEIFNRALNK